MDKGHLDVEIFFEQDPSFTNIVMKAHVEFTKTVQFFGEEITIRRSFRGKVDNYEMIDRFLYDKAAELEREVNRIASKWEQIANKIKDFADAKTGNGYLVTIRVRRIESEQIPVSEENKGGGESEQKQMKEAEEPKKIVVAARPFP